MNNSSGNNFQAKQESGGTNNNNSKLSKSTTTTTPSSSRQWGGFKNPRIVRVSRAFGGKDRHSKVCTIRGLRDRRIRLSVPTAIQLYDLQDRLGLNQPSKVVDWLLEVTKHEIDHLPPLQIPPGYFSRFQQPPLFSDQEYSADAVVLQQHLREKSNVTDTGESGRNKSIVEDNIGGYNNSSSIPQISAQSFFPLGNSYYHWEPNSNLSLAQFGNPQIEDSQNSNNLPLSLASSFPNNSGSHQLYFNPLAATTTFQPIIPPYNNYPLDFLNSTTTSQHVLPNSVVPTLNLISNSPMKPFISLNDDPRWNIQSRNEDDDDDGGGDNDDDDEDDDDDDSQPHEGARR